jgi:hypothetical protein
MQVLLLFSNTNYLWKEFKQLKKGGGTWCKRVCEYFKPEDAVEWFLWNWLDCVAIVCVYVAIATHLLAPESHWVTQSGAAAVFANGLAILKLLKPFPSMGGSLVMTFEAIFEKITGFMVVLGIMLVGFTIAFMISMPDNRAFEDGGEFWAEGKSYGLMTGIMNAIQSMLGNFDASDYTNAESKFFFIIYLFLMLVIMLNM